MIPEPHATITGVAPVSVFDSKGAPDSNRLQMAETSPYRKPIRNTLKRISKFTESNASKGVRRLIDMFGTLQGFNQKFQENVQLSV